MMCTTAGYHANHASWFNLLKQNLDPFISLQLALPDWLLIVINAIYLKYTLCQIYANSDNFHGELLSR